MIKLFKPLLYGGIIVEAGKTICLDAAFEKRIAENGNGEIVSVPPFADEMENGFEGEMYGEREEPPTDDSGIQAEPPVDEGMQTTFGRGLPTGR
ncbi:hypothetical protein EDD70_2968 [Hydrogenoanaerobacterium saccharovorans]|uniref:Uncharacterized protein n=1 Tax=Hydrogenoanaerobacterium saccharovorans TaxID=474960 RepID=A0A1H7YHL7_9FIRM|nr:hypothetical protein [Hydrogenoanaerobacterium saccharovorans]RPF41908.1 hypothetical protein EDD70_2968 [Hydrogenoanaerobacterium saccharovorans]SEM45610.1 hypothetical protein SAMN05216180_0051 [Hydrogenoanaerobacterium saccharovorans]